MNIAYFLRPKKETSFLYEDHSFRRGLEKMRRLGYSAMPVIRRDGGYVGVVTEGDFLWRMFDGQSLRVQPDKNYESLKIRDILSNDRIKPVRINVSMEELLLFAQNQNFIPVLDDTDCFIGIVTRKEIIRYFAAELLNNENENHGAALRRA